MVISFLWRPQKALEKWVSLSPPQHLQIQRPRDGRRHRAGLDRAQSCQVQTSTWPRMDQHLSCALSPERAWTQLCSAMGQQLPHDSHPSGFCAVSSCISRISQERAEISLPSQPEALPRMGFTPSPSNRSCVVCASSIYLNLLHLDPSQTLGRRTRLKSSMGWKWYQQHKILPPHPGLSSHQHHLLTCFSSPSKRKPGKNRAYSVTKRSDKP